MSDPRNGPPPKKSVRDDLIPLAHALRHVNSLEQGKIISRFLMKDAMLSTFHENAMVQAYLNGKRDYAVGLLNLMNEFKTEELAK